MSRNFGIGILIFCFSLSNIDVPLAAQAIEVPPVIVQPYDLSTINQQLYEAQRENHQQALANAALARKQNAAAANHQEISKYDELINLTEDVNHRKGPRQPSELNEDVLQGKYKILTDLKNEMMALNKNLSLHPKSGLVSSPFIIEHLNGQRQIRSREAPATPEFNPTPAAKDEIIKQQKDHMVVLKAQLQELSSDLKTKDESVRWLKEVLAVAKNKAEYYRLTSLQEQLSMQQIQAEAQDLKDDFARHFKDYDHFENAIVSLKGQASRLNRQLSQKQEQVDLLKSELENKITEAKDRENQISTMQSQIQTGGAIKEQADSLKQELATQQDKADQLKQQLDIKTTQSDQTALMLDEYQEKLESKDKAYNEQLAQLLSSRNYQAKMEAQIAQLNARLQQKEAQIVKIKENMYDLQKSVNANERESQAKDLSLSITQQKVITRLKAELALARQSPKAVPNSDEINFLRTAFKTASAELEKANSQIKDLQARADQSSPSLRNDALEKKLAQALDKMNEQGRVINALVQKLQDCGQSVNLTQYTGH